MVTETPALLIHFGVASSQIKRISEWGGEEAETGTLLAQSTQGKRTMRH